MIKNNKIIIINDNNEEKEYLILSRFNITNKKEQYILFTDKSFDKKNNMIIYSGILDGEKIREVKDKEDIALIDKYLNKIEQEMINKKN